MGSPYRIIEEKYGEIAVKYMGKWSVWTSNHWPADGCFNNDRLKVVFKTVQAKRLKAEEDKQKIALRLWQAEIEKRSERKLRSW